MEAKLEAQKSQLEIVNKVPLGLAVAIICEHMIRGAV